MKRDRNLRWPLGLLVCAGLVFATLSAGCGGEAAESGVVRESAALGGTITLPGRIQAEDYKTGGEGVGYHDTTALNSGGQYRQDDVDIETTSDTGAGFNVGWIAAGEWLAYSVNVASSGTYQLTARVASAVAGTKTVAVTLDGSSLGQASFSDASGWQSWRDLPISKISLSAGSHTLRIQLLTGNFNLNYLDVTQQVSAISLPGRIQAESYNPGGEGVGYHDTTTGNAGGQYRQDNVDIETTSDVGGGYDVGWTDTGEWLEYTVNVTKASTYALTARVASGVAGSKTLGVTSDGVSLGSASFTSASGWQSWQNLLLARAPLAVGTHKLRVLAQTGGFNLNYLDVADVAD
ncbi:MAG TPA: carbohydrate-binding protein, partial [Polyangiaceae bacterium]